MVKVLIFFLAAVTASAKNKPLLSPNVLHVKKCLPEITSESLGSAFSLEKLREEIDKKYVSLQSDLKVRKWQFQDRQGKEHYLTAIPTGKANRFELRLEGLDAQGLRINKKLPAELSRPATAEAVSRWLAGSKILKDEKTFHDTKLNGVELDYQLSGDRLIELVFRKKASPQKLYCHVKEGVGPLCLCN